MSKKKNLIVLLVVFVALAGIYLGVATYSDYAAQKKEEKEQAESEENRIWITDLDEVKEISYDNGTANLSFIKEDGEWKYKDAEDFPLVQSYLTALEETVSHLEASRKLEGGDELEAYGLSEPQASVTVTDAEGNETTLEIGDSVDSEYYLAVKGEEIPYTVGSSLYSEIQYDLYDMIEMEEFPDLSEETILSVEVKNEDGSYVLEKTEAATPADATNGDAEEETESETESEAETTYEWYLEENGKRSKVVNESLCNTLLNDLYSLSFQSCDNYKGSEEELEEAGLNEETTSFTVRYQDEDGEEAEFTVIVGNKKEAEEDESSSEYYARMSDSEAINTLSETVVEDITGNQVSEYLE